jgi:O-antigen/teichoic acid export membrane protein
MDAEPAQADPPTAVASSPGITQQLKPQGTNVAELARPAIRRMLLSASGTAVLQGFSSAAAFALSVILARGLGASGYGSYALAFAWSGFLIVPAILGFDRFLVRGIAVYELRGDWHKMRGLLRRTNELVLAVSVAVAVAGMAIAVAWLSPSLRGPFIVAMLLVPLTSLTLLRQGAMQAFGRIIASQLPEYLIRPVLIIVGIVVLELVGNGALTPTSALAANVFGVSVAFVVGAILLSSTRPAALRHTRADFATKEWLRAAVPMMLISGAWLGNSYVATLAVGAFDGARAAGIYNVVQKGAELIVVLLVAANMPLAPAVARLYAEGDRHRLEHTTERMARATLLLSTPIALVLVIAPGLYLGIFGSDFRSGATALMILAIGQLVNAAAGPSGNVLIMTGHEQVAARGVIAGLVLNLALAVVLVPRLGVTGGAIAFASSLVVWNVALVVIARRLLSVNVTAFRGLSIQGPAQQENEQRG